MSAAPLLASRSRAAHRSGAQGMNPGNASRLQKIWQRGIELRRVGDIRGARASFMQAVQLDPGNSGRWLVVALCDRQLDDAEDALKHVRRSFELDRTNAAACQLTMELLQSRQHLAALIQSSEMLDASVERDAAWHLARAQAFMGLLKFKEAVQESTLALTKSGDNKLQRANALMRLGEALRNIKAHSEAAWCFRMLLDENPRFLGAAISAAHCSSWACDWVHLASDIESLQTCIDRVRERGEREIQSIGPFGMLSLTDDPQVLRWVSERSFGQRVDAAKLTEQPWQPRAVAQVGGKYRIGLLSNDFHAHATSILVAEMLEWMDRDRFELYLYSGGQDDGSELRRRVRATAHCWQEMAEWTTEQLARQIAQDQIAVLVDMKGYTMHTRIDVMACRAAPVQVSWLGYPGTTGAACIDYMIGDPFVTPLESQCDYTERIAQMPHCYQPNDSTRTRPQALSREACGLPAQGFVFASFNMPYKIVPEVFEAWCRILLATPDSVLWLLVESQDVQQRLRQSALGFGVDPERLVFAPFVGAELHRARLPNADLFLDCFPCSGHTTASDALWAGVPVLTLSGQSFASRVAASLLHTLGLQEMVCDNIDRYLQEGARWAADPVALADLRQRLEAARTASPLFDGRRYARDFGALLLRMVERQNAGLPPEPLPAVERIM